MRKNSSGKRGPGNRGYAEINQIGMPGGYGKSPRSKAEERAKQSQAKRPASANGRTTNREQVMFRDEPAGRSQSVQRSSSVARGQSASVNSSTPKGSSRERVTVNFSSNPSRSQRALHDMRESRELREGRQSRDVRDMREERQSRDVRELRDERSSRETSESRDDRQPRESRDERETRETRSSRETRGAQDGQRIHAPQGMSRGKKQTVAGVRELTVRAFYIILALGCLLGLLFFLRPSVSEVENRNLTTFPELTWDSFVSGSFFSDLSLWYADTFPFREQLVSVDQSFKQLYGVATDSQMVGGTEKADEIPDEAQGAAQLDDDGEIVVPNERAMAKDIQDNIMKGLYVKDGAAYSIYYFSQESVEGYAAAINKCAKELEGKANVYSVLIPNNSGVMLSEDVLEDLGGSDQRQAIRYFNSLYEDSIITVDILDTLREHNEEYLYFNTDHHWTQLGAYYAYLKYCEVAGIEPVPIEDHEKMTFSPFLGTFYQQLNKNQSMKSSPDYVDAYIPLGTNDMEYIPQESTEWTEGKVVLDVTGWNQGSFYNTFIAGDEPLVKIENPEIEEDTSVLLVKDSFGNAFAPWLVDNYKYVYVIDFRYFNGKIPQFVEENGIQNVIFMNNLSMAGTNTVADKLATLM